MRPFLFFLTGLCCFSLRVSSQTPQHNFPRDGEIAPIEYSRDTAMKQLDRLHVILNRITIFMGDQFNTRRIEHRLPAISHTLQVISNSLPLSDIIPEFKDLQLYGVMLDDIATQLASWRSGLFRYDQELSDIDGELLSFSHDSTIRRLATDSLYQELYLEELRELRQKWQQARQATEINLTRIKQLQLAISRQYFLTVNLKSLTAEMKRRLTEQLFRNEDGYIWDRTARNEIPTGARQLAFRAFRAQAPLIGYFIDRNRISYICILLIGSLFFWWLRRNAGAGGKLAQPALYALIVMLNIHPLFELHASTLPASQLPLLVVLSILFWLKWPRRQFLFWVVMVALYVFLLITRTALIQLNGGMGLLSLNLLSITIGYYSLKRIGQDFQFKGLIRLARWVYLLLHFSAIIANCCGRQSLARILTTSSLFGVVQAIGMAIFMDCLLESFRLQERTGERNGKGLQWARISGQVEKGLFRFFRLSVLMIWLLSLAINLNVYDYLRLGYRQLLYHPVNIGSLSFQLGNLLLFFLILYTSNILQHFIGLIFSADEHALPETAKNGSRIAMLRLIVIIGGFLMAIAGSGIPLGKITIILGALGVGIGLGLQSIVNNLVSGVILVFEQPFQIGDLIELNRKKGIVRDIGIRSSKIVTEDGAEVIVPNGDLLSGLVINWTGTAHRVRTAISLTVEGSHDITEIETIVQTALTHQPGLSTEHKPHVLINRATERSTNITVLFWVNNIGRIEATKSEVLSVLYQRLKEKGLQII